MSVQIRGADKGFELWDGFSDSPIDPQRLKIGEAEIRKYIKTYPFPDDPSYLLKTCIHDIVEGRDSYTIPTSNELTVEYIADMLNDLSDYEEEQRDQETSPAEHFI